MVNLMFRLVVFIAISQPILAREQRQCSVLISEVKANSRLFGTIGFVAEYDSSYFLVFDAAYVKQLNASTRCMMQIRGNIVEYGLGEFVDSPKVRGYKSYPACCIKISKRLESECSEIAVRLSDSKEISTFPKRLYANSVFQSERSNSRIGLPFVSVPVDIIGEFKTPPPHEVGERVFIASPVALPNLSPVVEEIDGEFFLQGLLYQQVVDQKDQPTARCVLTPNRLLRSVIRSMD